MKTNIFRIIRIFAATVCFVLLAVLFIDWGRDVAVDPLRSIAAPLARWQVVPAVMAVSVATLVVLLVLTLLFGRIYCSVLCPLGVLQDGVNVAGKASSKRAAARFSYRKPRRWMRYGVLALTAVLVAAGIGGAVALVDPYGIFGRIIYDGLRPLAQGCNNFLAVVAGDSFAREPITVSWVSAAIAFVMLAVTGVSAWRGGRAYCNSFCPVGTLLGEVSRASLFKMDIDTDKCVSCGVCERRCKGSCIDSSSHTVDPSRCVVCFDCIDACPARCNIIQARMGSRSEGFRCGCERRGCGRVAPAIPRLDGCGGGVAACGAGADAAGVVRYRGARQGALCAAPSRGAGRSREPRPPACEVYVVPPVRKQVPGACAAAGGGGVRAGGGDAPRHALRQGVLPL